MSSIGTSPEDNLTDFDEMEEYFSAETSNIIDEITKAIDDTTIVDPEDPENISVKKELDKIVQDSKEMEILPDVVEVLIQNKKLNTMVLDLYDYDVGYDISFQKFGDVEILHGRYSYGVSLIEYIRDGEIPYEIFDLIYNYQFKIYYDGYVFCRLRIQAEHEKSMLEQDESMFEQEEDMYKQEKSIRSHSVLLKHTIQIVDKECQMKRMLDSSLDPDRERARLINHYSQDLCLDPNPVVAEIVISNELNQHPFITPYLRHFIENEKARREMGVKEMFKNFANYSEPAPEKPEDDKDWNFRLRDPTAEEEELSKFNLRKEGVTPIISYLKEREICFPDKDSLTGFHVEIENFVYEYDGRTRAGNVESIQDKLCIGVLDDKEYYYGAYKLDERMKDYVPFYWWPIGSREELDLHVIAITKEEMKLSCSRMKITHNRIFDEEVDFSGEETRIVPKKLENPASRVILRNTPPSSQSENDEMDDN